MNFSTHDVLRNSMCRLFHLFRLFRLSIFDVSNQKSMETILKRTSGDDQKIALGSMSRIKAVSNKLRTVSSAGVKIRIHESGEFITIPKKALSLLIEILSNMSEGRSISIIPTDSELSTQQAADMLRVSRPHLIKLLENNIIPFKKVGSHRRILLKDLIIYEKHFQKMRAEQLKFLSEQAQHLNLGYE
jgi:excisionase family DNA binding protein